MSAFLFLAFLNYNVKRSLRRRFAKFYRSREQQPLLMRAVFVFWPMQIRKRQQKVKKRQNEYAVMNIAVRRTFKSTPYSVSR